MEEIQAAALVEKFVYALKCIWGYIWGTAGVIWTAAKQQQKVDYMVSKYGTNWKNSSAAKEDNYYGAAMYGSKWIGHTVADCSGLFVWAFKQLGGAIAHGSNSIYDRYCLAKGVMTSDIKKTLKPGTAVFTSKTEGGKVKHNHIGLYIGDGRVIEAKGTQAGVVESKITDSKWTYYGELKDVNYGPSPEPPPEPKPEKGYAIVTGKNLALREGPSTSTKVITRAPTGTQVKITDVPEEWEYVTYNGKTGFMMKEYLNEG